MVADRSETQTLLDRMSSEVSAETSPLLRFLTGHGRKIMLLLAVCVLAGAGYGVYTWQQGRAVAEAQTALARILILQNQEERLSKLKAFAPTAPEAMRKGAMLAYAQAAMQAKNYPDALQAWESLGTAPGDPLYATAMIGKAEALALQGKVAEAMTCLEGVTLPADSDATGLINALLEDFAEQTGNIEKAIALCDKLSAGLSARSPQEAEFWRQKAASLRAAKS